MKVLPNPIPVPPQPGLKPESEARSVEGKGPDAIGSLKPLAKPISASISKVGNWLSARGELRSPEQADAARPKDAAETRKQEIMEAGKQFEALFMRYLVTAMRSGVTGEGNGGPQGSHFYEGLIDENLSQILAESGNGLQIGEMLSRSQFDGPTEEL